MLHIHVTGCNVCPFAVYEYDGEGEDWICKLIQWIDPTVDALINDPKKFYEEALSTIPDNCPLDVTITK